MITTISLSPAIDKRLEFEHFSIGGTNRVRRAEAEGAGKAVNVALGLQALGLSALCAGILPDNGRLITERLEAGHVACDFLPAPGSVRVNQKLFDRSTQVLTEINESCPPMTPELVAAAEELAVAHAKESEFLVLTGSLPPKCPADWYARVLRRVHREAPQCRVVLDAEGERFALAVAEKPWLVKPNQYELGLFAGRPLDTREDILAAARALNRRGVEVVVVSMGKDGALAVRGEEDVFVPADRLIGTEGSGFAQTMKFLAGKRPVSVAGAVGVAQRALDLAVDYARERSFKHGPIAKLEGIQFLIADMEMRIQASRAMAIYGAQMTDAGIPIGTLGNSLKCFASEMCYDVVNMGLQVFAGYGYSREYPLEKLLRDARIYSIFEGTNQVQRQVIGKTLLG